MDQSVVGEVGARRRALTVFLLLVCQRLVCQRQVFILCRSLLIILAVVLPQMFCRHGKFVRPWFFVILHPMCGQWQAVLRALLKTGEPLEVLQAPFGRYTIANED